MCLLIEMVNINYKYLCRTKSYRVCSGNELDVFVSIAVTNTSQIQCLDPIKV